MRAMATILALALAAPCAAQTYVPPAASAQLLSHVDLAAATPVDEAYRAEFARCDGLVEEHAGKDTFLGYATPEKCSSDPSTVRALLNLTDGGVFWDSKMALDVDGSQAAIKGGWTNAAGKPRKTTDQCATAKQWRHVTGDECRNPDAQVDADLFPYAVVPAAKTKFLPAAKRGTAARQFRDATKLEVGDLGVIISGGQWTPAFIADTGSIFRLGEGSSRAFRELGQSRCRNDRFDAAGHCVGDGSTRYPFVDRGADGNVIFIFYPGTGHGLTKQNAIARMCDLARTRLGLTGSPVCPK